MSATTSPAGSDELCADLERTMGPEGSVGADGERTWLRSPCLGLCERAPAAMITAAGIEPSTTVAAPVDAAGIAARIGPSVTGWTSYGDPPIPQQGQAGLRLLARVG